MSLRIGRLLGVPVKLHYTLILGVLLIAWTERIERLRTRVYNVVSLVPTPSAKEIATAVKKYVPRAKITFRPEQEATEIIRSWPKDFDITRAQREFGWQSKYSSLDTLVKDFVNEVRQHPDMYKI